MIQHGSKISCLYRLSTIKDNLVLAHNEEYLDKDSRVNLREGDEIAVIPPISGG